MPRIRTIKPQYWTDAKIQSLSVEARLMYIGLWNYADDSGRFLADPRLIKAAVFPIDDNFPPERVYGILRELSGSGRVIVWMCDGEMYGEIPNFRKHQVINKPGKSSLPSFADHSGRATVVFPEDSRTEVGSRKEEVGSRNVGDRNEEIGDCAESKKVEIPSVLARRTSPGKPESGTLFATGEKKPKPPVERTPSAWSIWIDLHRELELEDPLPLGPDLSASKHLWAALKGNIEDYTRICNAYLADRDPFIIKHGHALQYIKAQKYQQNIVIHTEGGANSMQRGMSGAEYDRAKKLQEKNGQF